MSQEQAALSFELNESLFFRQGEEVAEMIGISMEPLITIHPDSEYVQLRGVLQLEGEYRKDAHGHADYMPLEDQERHADRHVETVQEISDQLLSFSHRFPIEIAIPAERVPDLEDIKVRVESFDYVFPANDQLRVNAQVQVYGIEPLEQEESEPREEPADWAFDAEADAADPFAALMAKLSSSADHAPDDELDRFEFTIFPAEEPEEEPQEAEKEESSPESSAAGRDLTEEADTEKDGKEDLTSARNAEQSAREEEGEPAQSQKQPESKDQANLQSEAVSKPRQPEAKEEALPQEKPGRSGSKEAVEAPKLNEDTVKKAEDEQPSEAQAGRKESVKKQKDEKPAAAEKETTQPSGPVSTAEQSAGDRPSEETAENSAAEQKETKESSLAAKQSTSKKTEAKQRTETEIHAQAEQDQDNVGNLTDLFGGQTEETFTRMRLYIVQERDTLETIAERYQVPITRLLQHNQMDSENIGEGQLIYIPYTQENKA